MRLAQFHAKNYRSLEDVSFDVPQVCALVGPNNSGKSNILLAIKKVLGRDWLRVTDFKEDDVFLRDPDRDITIDLTFDPALRFRAFKNADPVDIAGFSFDYTRYVRGSQKGERRLEQRCVGADGKVPIALTRAPQRKQRPQFGPLVGIPSTVREQIPVIHIGTHRRLEEHLPSARFSILRQLFEDIVRDFETSGETMDMPQREGGTKAVPRRDVFARLMERVIKTLRTRSFEDLETSIKRNALQQLGFDPTTDAERLDLFFAPLEPMDFYRALDLRVREGDFTISATALGEGVQNAIVLSLVQVLEERRKKGAIILIEEPEMFLHPQQQRSLYRTLRRLGETNQVIYTTHSPHFVAIPEFRDIVLVRRPSMATTVTLSTLAQDARRREKLVKEFDPERNELFFASRLLLVEGDTEKLALPEYAQRVGVDLDRAGATIVEVGGKRNLLDFATIAISFGMPTGIVYDLDSSDFRDQRADERAFNEQLDNLATEDGTVRVWQLRRAFEDHVRKATGERGYQDLCEKYAGRSKAVKQRLIAADPSTPVPTPFEEVLRWAAG